MPSLSQVRSQRIRHLVVLARRLHEAGVASNFLIGKLEMLVQRSWPEVREETRKGHVRSALRTVLSRPPAESVLPEAVEPAQEGPPQWSITETGVTG